MINKISTLFTLLFFCLISSVELFADQGESSLIISDGPYVMVNSNELEVNWLCENTVKQVGISSNKLPFNFEHCGLDIIIDRDKFLNDALIYQGDFKVAAASDFHGQYDLMLKLLMNNHIINDKKQWVFGNGHFVITGDVFDRGDKVTEILWFLYQLEQQAEQAGGKVHLLLGNHEVMVLNGDLRYLHPKYVETAKRLQQPFERLYGKDTL